MTASVLYSRDILRLAASLILDDHLENPDATAEMRSPTCGSRITAEIMTNAKRQIADLALRANACALGQASAAILRANAKGQDQAAILTVRAGLVKILKGEDAKLALWPGLEQFAVARDFPARHAAILLPYDAVLAALEQAN